MRADWKAMSIGFGVGSREAELADVEKERAEFWSHVTEEFGPIEHLHKVVDCRGEWALFGSVRFGPVSTPACEQELLGCFGDFGPVDGNGGGRGG